MDVNIVPMAGIGSRFSKAGFSVPKPLIPIKGKPMIQHAIRSMPDADRWVFIVRSEHIYFGLEKAIKTEVPDAIILPIDHVTRGGVETALLAEKHLSPDDSAFISACDIAPEWNMQNFLDMLNKKKPDAVVFGFKGDARVLKHPSSYSWIDADRSGKVNRISIKKPISKTPLDDSAVVGSFWFSKWANFALLAKDLLDSHSNTEYHLEMILNKYAEKGKNISLFNIDRFICWGTPEELEEYVKGAVNE